MVEIKLTKIGWINIKILEIKNIFLLKIIFIALTLNSCSSIDDNYQETDLNKILESLPDNADYIDKALFDSYSQGCFISLLVKNKMEIKRLIIHNGLFYHVYMGDNLYKMEKYRRIVEAPIIKKEAIELNDNQWKQINDYLIDTTDQFSKKQFNDSLSYYFPNGVSSQSIPRKTLLMLADRLFQEQQYFLYQDDYSGFYRLDSFDGKDHTYVKRLLH